MLEAHRGMKLIFHHSYEARAGQNGPGIRNQLDGIRARETSGSGKRSLVRLAAALMHAPISRWSS